MTIRQTLESMFFDSTRPVRLVMMWAYAMSAVGIYMRSADSSGDMALLFSIAPGYVWIAACIALSVARLLGLFTDHFTTYLTRRLTPIVGIVIWSTLLAAGLAVEPRGMSLLYMNCAAIEVWLLARAFAANIVGD